MNDKKPPQNGTIFIGIDPGINTGFAVWIKKRLHKSHFGEICSLDFWKVIDRLEEFHHVVSEQWDMRLVVVIEDPNLNPAMHPSIKQHLHGSDMAKELMLLKMAQNLGGNKKEASLLIQWCERNGVQVIGVKPTKSSNTKMDAVRFNKLTGWNQRSNEHGRDAAMLVWGK